MTITSTNPNPKNAEEARCVPGPGALMRLSPTVKFVFSVGVTAHFLAEDHEHEILWFLGVWIALIAVGELFVVVVNAWRARRGTSARE